jgi:hypothetical protein
MLAPESQQSEESLALESLLTKPFFVLLFGLRVPESHQVKQAYFVFPVVVTLSLRRFISLARLIVKYE